MVWVCVFAFGFGVGVLVVAWSNVRRERAWRERILQRQRDTTLFDQELEENR